MDLWNASRDRLLCAEPLEGRWLLSGIAVSSSPYVDGGVHVIGIEEEIDDGEDVDVAPTDLPHRVRTALEQEFPGARLLEADFSVDEGEAEYSVAARLDGRSLEVALSPRGRITEVEEVISTEQLPAAILDWARRNGAEIDEAVTVSRDGVLNYEVLIAAPDGKEYEALLQVPSFPTENRLIGTGTDDQTAETPTTTPDDVITIGDPDTGAAVISVYLAATAPADVPREETSLEPGDLEDKIGSLILNQSRFNLYSAGSSEERARWTGDRLRALVVSAAPTAWLPELAAALSDVLPAELEAIERLIREIVDQIDLLTEERDGGSLAARSVLGLAALAALLAGVQLLLDARKPKAGPALVFNARSSSWSWILGSPPDRR